MKVLGLGLPQSAELDSHEFVNSNLANATPFGYDVIIVDGHQSLYQGSLNTTAAGQRWNDAISKWSGGKRTIIVMMYQLTSSYLTWISNDIEFTKVTLAIEEAGWGNFLGNVTSSDPVVKKFLNDNKSEFSVSMYLKVNDSLKSITVNSGVDNSLLTSFTYEKDDLKVVFIPYLNPANLSKLINAYQSPSSVWSIEEATELQRNISDTDAQINALDKERDELYEKLNKVNSEVTSVIESDIYLGRAISHFDAARFSEHPNPESYYGAIEAVENAFASEREMREVLNLSKNYVGKVTQRANSFRHEAKDGQGPTPLSAEEVTDFNERLNHIISSYIDYLMNK